MQMMDVVERIRNLSMAVNMTGCSNESEQKVSDEIATLRAENERLRAALEQLLACPAIADGNHNDPAWACHETAAAETFARKVLARAALEGRT